MKHIIVGLQIDNEVIDLKIPIEVSVARLKELLREALKLLNISLPSQFNLIIKNKRLLLSDSAMVSNYPIGNGDQVLVISIDS